MVRIVETNTSRTECGHADHVVEEEEAERFMKAMARGAGLRRRSTTSGFSEDDRFALAAAKVREKLFLSLQGVTIFSALSTEQLELLRDAMVQAPFDNKHLVFEQDDDGDAFYVIIEGTARALKNWGDGKPEEVLKEFVAGDFFGERALLKNDKRFASVQATSALDTMCITRANFESILGPLADLVPDNY